MTRPYILRKGVSELADLADGQAAMGVVSQYKFYVSSVSGNNNNEGDSFERPFATLAYAMSKCVANRGDVIYVMPGHAETLTAAVAASVAGARIIGLGTGLDRPELTVGANNIDGISITADGVLIDNLYFNEATVATANANINIAAANAVIRNVHMDMGANDRDGFTVTAAGEKPTIEDCTVIVTADGPDTWITFEGVVDMPIIRRNYVVASNGTAEFDDEVIDFGGQAVTNPIVVDNVFDGADVAVDVISDAASVVGDCFGGNKYAGSATDGDTVTTATSSLGAGAITAAVVATGAIDADAIADNAIDAGALAGDCITAAKIADDAFVAANFATGALTADAFAANAIVAATLNADCITNAKIADDAIAAENIATGALTADAFAADALVAATFATDAITADAIADNAIDAGAIAANAITNAKIADGAISSGKFAAGAIDATVIADGAIDATAIAAAAIEADAFAADAITNAAIADDAIAAENIATGALTADAFAADALVAATFATDAITADAIADSAIDAGAIAADAITNAKIADGALASEQFALSAGEKTTDGIIVTRATAALPQTTAGALFTITGHVLLKRILGVVTVQVGAVGNVTHLQLNSTGAGATTDLCLAGGGLDITGDVADTMYEITGTFGDAMVATTNLPKAPSQAADIVLPPGSLEIECAGSDGGTGRVRWSVTYVPMEAGAQVVAA